MIIRFNVCFTMLILTKPLVPITFATCTEDVLNSLLAFFASYLMHVSSQIINTFPAAWKSACIAPVPKRPVILSMNDLRPVAVSSAVIKVYEQVVLCKLDISVKDYIDPLQFSYLSCRRNRSINDAVLICVLENIYSHFRKKRQQLAVLEDWCSLIPSVPLTHI